MPLRTFTGRYAVATYPCNNIYVTEITDRYCRRVKETTSRTYRDAKETHYSMVDKAKEMGRREMKI